MQNHVALHDQLGAEREVLGTTAAKPGPLPQPRHRGVDELIEMVKKFQEAVRRGETRGLNHDEMAPYDALAMNEAAVRNLRDEILKKSSVELTLSLRKSVSVDWAKRHTVWPRCA